MMGFSFIFLMFPVVFLSITSGGNDLLDYVPTQTYWQVKNVEPTLSNMEKELSPAAAADTAKPIEDLANADPQTRAAAGAKLVAMGQGAVAALQNAVDAGDPETASQGKELLEKISLGSKPTAVRRLMAIRALGESKEKDALKILEPLLASKQPFEADYAAAASAQLQGQPYERPSLSNEDRRADAYALPADVAGVLQIAAHDGHPLPIDEFVDQMQAIMGMGTGITADQKRQQETQLIDVAEKLGNVRFEAITMGVAANVSDQVGYVVLDGRIRCDAKATVSYIESQSKLTSHNVGSYEVLNLDNNAWVCFSGQDHVVMITGPHDLNDTALQGILDSVLGGKEPLQQNAAMAGLIDSVINGGPVWGAMQVTPAYKQAPLLASFDTVTLSSTLDTALHLNLAAKGSDAAGATAAARQVTDGVNDALGGLRNFSDHAPALKPVVGILESIKPTTDAGNLTVVGDIPRSLLDDMLSAAKGGSATTAPTSAPAAMNGPQPKEFPLQPAPASDTEVTVHNGHIDVSMPVDPAPAPATQPN